MLSIICGYRYLRQQASSHTAFVREQVCIPFKFARWHVENFRRLVPWTLAAFILTHIADELFTIDPQTEDSIAAICHGRKLAKLASKLPGFNPNLDVFTWMWQPANNITISSKEVRIGFTNIVLV